jgi:methylase of polypeptide subunit release factors
MSIDRHHAEWLYFLEPSGPFLTVPVLSRAFPQGLDMLEKELVARLRLAHEEWTEVSSSDQQASALHNAWIRLVLTEGLGYPPEALVTGEKREQWSVAVPEHGEKLIPNFAVVDPTVRDGVKPRLLIGVSPRAQGDLEGAVPDSDWAASPAERMAILLRATGIRLGLVTNGEQWVLVSTAEQEAVAYAHWHSSLWFEESVTLRSLVTLLGARRFFGVGDNETLEAMLLQSASYQHEVTEQLGAQVRKAVEVLVQALDRADQDSGRTLLDAVTEQEIYEAAVTVMMRLVFLFAAEERDLLLLGDPIYDQQYAVSTLRGQLREEADRVGEEVLERRRDAWLRLLATFRALYGGIQHESLRLPAYGGSLFDPDRYPFLEGREDGTRWRDSAEIDPLPVDNRTVLLLLESLQLLRTKGSGGSLEAQRLSFRGLDVEQIGHVYEGLLDHVAVRLSSTALGLNGAGGIEPEVALPELESKAGDGQEELVDYLKEQTGRSKPAIENALRTEPDADGEARLLVSCRNDRDLMTRVLPYHALLRNDVWGYPVVYHAGSFAVTAGIDRRTTGTHYTPRSLTEEIVQYALEPLVYKGPAEGLDRASWKLRSAKEILELRVCDPAMGSGAFLVQVCRYLSERLIEAWREAQEDVREITIEGRSATGAIGELPVPPEPEDRLSLARRLIAERCIYGVDVNPMAVEMAKLSIWLITLAKGRPFEFLDHALKCGDSLIGIHDLDQVRQFHPDPVRGQDVHFTLFDPREQVNRALNRALELRKTLRVVPVMDARDAEQKANLSRQAESALGRVKLVANAVAAAALAWHDGRDAAVDHALRENDQALGRMFQREGELVDAPLAAKIAGALNRHKPPLRPDRNPFHWPLEFPEVFNSGQHGFNAIVMNPPFLGGQKITGTLGDDYREYLVHYAAGGKRGSADLAAYFLLQMARLVVAGGQIGSLATDTIAQGDTREVGLGQMVAAGWTIHRAVRSRPWPGDASLQISLLWFRHGEFSNRTLDGVVVRGITPMLGVEGRATGSAHPLRENEGVCFQGSILQGIGFVLEPNEALELLRRDPKNREVLFPYLTGEDLYRRPHHSAPRWVINFHDWPLSKAEQFPSVLEIVKTRVKPQRNEINRRRRRERWWLYAESAPGLYRAIRGLDHVIGIGAVSKLVLPAIVPTGQVYSHKVFIFASSDHGQFAVLSSSFHWWWAVTRSSTLGTTTNYAPTDCFLSFPRPELTEELRNLGRELDARRHASMAAREIGMTDLYNLAWKPLETSQDIRELRELHSAIDRVIAHAYGWDDLSLDPGFHDTRWGVRYTVSEGTQREILDRLLELNHNRRAQELAGVE